MPQWRAAAEPSWVRPQDEKGGELKKTAGVGGGSRGQEGREKVPGGQAAGTQGVDPGTHPGQESVGCGCKGVGFTASLC